MEEVTEWTSLHMTNVANPSNTLQYYALNTILCDLDKYLQNSKLKVRVFKRLCQLSLKLNTRKSTQKCFWIRKRGQK